MVTTYSSGGKRDSPQSVSSFTVTAWSESLSLAGTEAGAANVAAVLATLIKELQAIGILKGTTATP